MPCEPVLELLGRPRSLGDCSTGERAFVNMVEIFSLGIAEPDCLFNPLFAGLLERVVDLLVAEVLDFLRPLAFVGDLLRAGEEVLVAFLPDVRARPRASPSGHSIDCRTPPKAVSGTSLMLMFRECFVLDAVFFVLVLEGLRFFGLSVHFASTTGIGTSAASSGVRALVREEILPRSAVPLLDFVDFVVASFLDRPRRLGDVGGSALGIRVASLVAGGDLGFLVLVPVVFVAFFGETFAGDDDLVFFWPDSMVSFAFFGGVFLAAVVFFAAGCLITLPTLKVSAVANFFAESTAFLGERLNVVAAFWTVVDFLPFLGVSSLDFAIANGGR